MRNHFPSALSGRMRCRAAAIAIAVALGAPQAGASDILQKLQNLDKEDAQVIAEGGRLDIRLKAMRETALALGAQQGYANRVAELVAEVEVGASQYEQIFDFRQAMILAQEDASELFLLPPVIELAHDAAAVDDKGRLLKVAGEVYRIVRPARLVTAPPDWRSYLLEGLVDQEGGIMPAAELLPKDDEERAAWKAAVTRGWEAGVAQADSEMQSRIRRLGRDFAGMIRYMRLVEEGKVERPTVAVAHEQVAGDDTQMRVRESTYRLTRDAAFQRDAQQWRPAGKAGEPAGSR